MDKTGLNTLWGNVLKYANFACAAHPVPGMAMALVAQTDDGRWLTLDDYRGVRDVRYPDSTVGKDTVFQLASVSKPITATIITGLVASGRLGEQGWNRVASGVGLDTQPATIAELLCHLSGLPSHAGDLIEDMGADRAAVLGKLGLFQREPRPAPFAYTNFGYTAAAVAAAQAAGKQWEALAAELLYTPLGMTQTSSRHADFVKSPQHVSLHQQDGQGRWFVGEQRNPDAQSPAGGVSSTALDLTYWMRLCLGDTTRIADRKFHTELSRVLQPQPPSEVGPSGSTYSLGWNMSVDNTGRVSHLSHSGAFNLGAATCVTLLPQAKLGLVVLTNGWPIGVPEAISAAFAALARDPAMSVEKLETNRDDPPGHDGETLLEGVTAYMDHEMRPPPRIPYVPTQTPPKPREDLLGHYANALYGGVEVGHDTGGYFMLQGNRRYALGATPDPNVLIYDSAGENGSRNNGLKLEHTDYTRAWVDNLFYAYPQGPDVTPRSTADRAIDVEAILVQRPVSIIGLVRVWRIYATRAGRVQLRVYDEHYQLVDQSEVVTVEKDGHHKFVLSRAIWKSFRYFGFHQPEGGVIAYDEDATMPVLIRYPGHEDWADFRRTYSIQIDVDAHGVFAR